MNVLMILKAKILLETSAKIKQDIPYIAGSKEVGMPFNWTIKLKFLKVCRIKSV